MEIKEIVKNFIDADGKLVSFPAKRKMKVAVLYYLSTKFDSEKVYTEKEINTILNEWHTFADPATLRREMFDYKFLDRKNNGTEYHAGEQRMSLEELEREYFPSK